MCRHRLPDSTYNSSEVTICESKGAVVRTLFRQQHSFEVSVSLKFDRTHDFYGPVPKVGSGSCRFRKHLRQIHDNTRIVLKLVINAMFDRTEVLHSDRRFPATI